MVVISLTETNLELMHNARGGAAAPLSLHQPAACPFCRKARESGAAAPLLNARRPFIIHQPTRRTKAVSAARPTDE